MAETDLVREMSVAAMKASPPAVISLYAVVSSGLPTLVAFATLVYIIVQTAHLLWKWAREARAKAPPP